MYYIAKKTYFDQNGLEVVENADPLSDGELSHINEAKAPKVKGPRQSGQNYRGYLR